MDNNKNNNNINNNNNNNNNNNPCNLQIPGWHLAGYSCVSWAGGALALVGSPSRDGFLIKILVVLQPKIY